LLLGRTARLGSIPFSKTKKEEENVFSKEEEENKTCLHLFKKKETWHHASAMIESPAEPERRGGARRVQVEEAGCSCGHGGWETAPTAWHVGTHERFLLRFQYSASRTSRRGTHSDKNTYEIHSDKDR